MEQNRKVALITGTVGLIILTLITIFTENSPTFYWGIPVGIVFGIGMCIYLAEAWDPVGLQPTNPNTSKAGWNILWVVPLGIVAANILPDLVGDVIGGLLLGCLFSWLEITMIYFVFQLWWHRPK